MRIAGLPILLALALGAASASAKAPATAATGQHDFDFLNGTWDVHHHFLRVAAGRREWLDYDDPCVHRALSGDWSNMDEYVLGQAPDTYHAVALRAYDPASHEWSIWWLDQRFPGGPLDPPMKGQFLDKIGLFYSDYIAPDGRRHRTRMMWSQITSSSAHWEEADSGDGGKTWETYWTMDFKRQGAPAAS